MTYNLIMQLQQKKSFSIIFLIILFININAFAEPINDLQKLYGSWRTNKCTITFPVQINDIDYFKVEYKKEDISNKWYEICETRKISFQESLIIKDVILSKIYDKDYPLANELGVNEGIKIIYNTKIKKPRIKAQRIILIPKNIILTNLDFFDIKGIKLQMTNSISFSNSQIDDFFIEEKMYKKVLF